MRLLPATSSKLSLPLKDRLNLLKNLVSNLVLKEQIVTTPARAAAIRPLVEMLVQNAKQPERPDLRQESERWLIDHQKTLPLLYGPISARYQNRPEGFTRQYQLLHREYRHVPRAVIELIHGPRDTLQLLDKYKEELAQLKEQNKDALFTKPVEELMQGRKSVRKGRMHAHHLRRVEDEEQRKLVLRMAGREKSSYIMRVFAKNAIGQLPQLYRRQPRFWVR